LDIDFNKIKDIEFSIYRIRLKMLTIFELSFTIFSRIFEFYIYNSFGFTIGCLQLDYFDIVQSLIFKIYLSQVLFLLII